MADEITLTRVVLAAAALFAAPVIAAAAPRLYSGTKALFDWIKSKSAIAGHEHATAILQRFEDLIAVSVLHAEQTLVTAAKAQLASGDLSQENYKARLAAIKAEVLADVQAQATRSALIDDVKAVVAPELVGYPQVQAAMEYAGKYLEAKVAVTPPGVASGAPAK